MNFRHTPAPWMVSPRDDTLIITRAGFVHVARAMNTGMPAAPYNALVVAAAPCLLAAAARALIVLEGLAVVRHAGDAIEQLAAAIDRAVPPAIIKRSGC